MTIDFSPIFIIGIIALFLFIAIQRRQKRGMGHLFCFTLFWLYLLMVLNVVYFPLQIPRDWPHNITPRMIRWVISDVNLVPFRYGPVYSFDLHTIVWEVFGNILLTVPFGFLLPFLVRVPPRRVIWLVLLPGLALETLQLAFELLGMMAGYPHSVDISDVITNGTGALIGYGFYLVVTKLASAVLSRPFNSNNELPNNE